MFTQFEMFGKFHKGYSGASSTVEDPVFREKANSGEKQIVSLLHSFDQSCAILSVKNCRVYRPIKMKFTGQIQTVVYFICTNSKTNF